MRAFLQVFLKGEIPHLLDKVPHPHAVSGVPHPADLIIDIILFPEQVFQPGYKRVEPLHHGVLRGDLLRAVILISEREQSLLVIGFAYYR